MPLRKQGRERRVEGCLKTVLHPSCPPPATERRRMPGVSHGDAGVQGSANIIPPSSNEEAYRLKSACGAYENIKVNQGK